MLVLVNKGVFVGAYMTFWPGLFVYAIIFWQLKFCGGRAGVGTGLSLCQ